MPAFERILACYSLQGASLSLLSRAVLEVSKTWKLDRSTVNALLAIARAGAADSQELKQMVLQIWRQCVQGSPSFEMLSGLYNDSVVSLRTAKHDDALIEMYANLESTPGASEKENAGRLALAQIQCAKALHRCGRSPEALELLRRAQRLSPSEERNLVLLTLISQLFIRESTEAEAVPVCYELLKNTVPRKDYRLRQAALGYLVRGYSRNNDPRLAETLEQLVEESKALPSLEPVLIYFDQLAATSAKLGHSKATEMIRLYRQRLVRLRR